MSTREERFQRIDAAVFRTITGEDWKRAMARSRAERNVAWAQIREALRRAQGDSAQDSNQKILDLGLGNYQPGTTGNSNTGSPEKKP
jgi:hypothetical protein